MSYTIQITEQQRAIIEKALATLDDGRIPLYDGTDEDEACVLHLLFKELPADERTTPGALHRFDL